MFTKWYPNREDPQLGIFIRKHAQCIAKNNRLSILYLHTAKDNLPADMVIHQEGNLHEIILYLKEPNNIFSRLLHPFHILSAYRKGIREMKKTNPGPDIFHAYILLRTALVCYLLSIIYGNPYVISEQWSGYATGRYGEKNFFFKYLTRLLIRKAAGFSAVSHFLLEKMHAHGLTNEHEAVIGNVVNKYSSKQKTNASQIHVLLVADLVDEIKNISGVLQMIASLPQPTKERFNLRIIGGGKDEKKLKELADRLGILKKIVFFEGLKKNEEVYDYLSQTDFLVMNSRFETFSAICVEALSCGIPVLATDCGGPGEFIDQATGLLIPVDSKEEFTSGFLFMLDHHNDFKPDTLKSHVKSKYDEEEITRRFELFYPKKV